MSGTPATPAKGTPTIRYDVANLDQWGRLIKSWATHLDYVTQAAAPQPPRDYWVNTSWGATTPPAPATVLDIDSEGNPKPWCLPTGGPVVVPDADGGTVTLPFAVAMTVAEFKTRVGAAGVAITEMPAEYTNVVIVQGNAQTVVMRLPPKDMLQASEDDLLNGPTYPIRAFYSALYGGAPTMPTDAAGIMELHANRIGEYTLNNCM
jgi:hypothetical protein